MDFENQMIDTVKEYETKHGEIDLNDEKKMRVMYVNKDDAMVWSMLPLTDIQKKFIFIRLYGLVDVQEEEEVEPLDNSSQSSEI